MGRKQFRPRFLFRWNKKFPGEFALQYLSQNFKINLHIGTPFVVSWPILTQMGQRSDSMGAGVSQNNGDTWLIPRFTMKLNFKALRMGSVGIDIYGSRCHSSSRMVKFLVVPNARCSSTIGHYYLDLVEQNGRVCYIHAFYLYLHPAQFSSRPQWTVGQKQENCMQHMLLCGEWTVLIASLPEVYFYSQRCMPDISLEDAAAFVALKSTDNIPIESSWNLFTNYVGLDIKQIILFGKFQNYFHPSVRHHV
jgi:hypothetical protein